MKKICEICGQEFETVCKGHSRKYCFDCVPYIEKSKANRAYSITQQRRAVKRQLLKVKGGKCQKCGYDKCVEALEFHHIDHTEKEFELKCSSGIRPMYEYYKELEKCILVCANCHREIHHDEGYLHNK